VFLLAQCVVVANGASLYKWTQMPKMSDGYDFSSEIKAPSLVADDWLCQSPRPVLDVHWWGSYWYPGAGNYTYYSDGKQNVPQPLKGAITSFTISFWTDVPVGPKVIFSHPGQVLASYTITNFNETWYGPCAYTNFPGLVEDVYQYYTLLPVPFEQIPGTIYWLSIQSNFPTASQQWGWHQSETHWNDFAVQNWRGSGWYPPCGGVDMAFQLSVPEPGSLAALLTGMVAVGGGLIRRRRS